MRLKSSISNSRKASGVPSSRALSKACWAHSKKVPAVTALGQHVGGGQALQFAFKLLLLGDVFGDTDNDYPVAIVLLVDVALVAQPAQLPIGIEDAVLAVFHRALEQYLGQATFGELEVVG